MSHLRLADFLPLALYCIMISFQLKKFISQFLMPMPLVCECFLLGWVLFRFTKYKKTGRFFTLLSLLFFLFFSYGFGRTYLYKLERRYPPFDPTPQQREALRGAAVVVLGQGMPIKSDLPLRYQNNPVFERRLFEGVRVAKLIPESRLLVSMAGEASNSVKQAFLDEYMLQVNFPTNRVSMFTTARDTSEEAKLAKNCLIALLPYCVIGAASQTNNHCLILGCVSTTNALTNSRTNELLPALTHSRTNELLPALMNSRTNELLPALINSRTNELNNTLSRIVLATSASHIPRSIKIFQKLGFNPIAAPCDYTYSEEPKIEWKNWYQWPLPYGGNIGLSERALYEWLGNLFERTF